MANFDIDLDVQVPEKITMTLIREDFLDTSNNYRLFFEVAFGLFCAVGGSIISNLSSETEIPFITYIFLVVLLVACIAFLLLAKRSYEDAKCNGKIKKE